MENVQIFKYNDSPVTFLMGDENRMVNATQMAKSFSKRTNDWLSTKQATELIASLSAKTGIPATALVIVNQGGNNQGTWLHEDLAILFAQWLSPEFYLWCNDRIRELLRFGLTATEAMLLKATTDPSFVLAMMEHIKESREKNLLLAEKNKALEAQAEQNATKVQFFDNLQEIRQREDARNSYNVSAIARELGMSAAGLNRLLIKKGVAIKIDGSWFIAAKYIDSGYAVERLTMTRRLNEDDVMAPDEITYLTWTVKGREFSHSLIAKH